HVDRGTDHRPVPRDAVEDDAPGLEPLNASFEVGEVAVDLHLLRRLIPYLDHAALDLTLKVDADRGRVSDHVILGLIERHHQTTFVTPRTFGMELQPHDGLPDA